MVDQNVERQYMGEKEKVTMALYASSMLPYNNASHVYEAAGMEPDIRLGGSCLKKLDFLRQLLPSSVQDTIRFATSSIRQTTHFAMTLDMEGGPYYLDPFLWQKEPMPLVDLESSVGTLENVWKIKREPDEAGKLFIVSLQESKPEENVLVTHKYEHQLVYLPAPSTLPIKSELPSFNMQVPDFDKQVLYKIWFSKSLGIIDNMWTFNGANGNKAKITNDPSHRRQRQEAVGEIERLLDMSEGEINDYFIEARKIEMQLAQTKPTNEIPADHEM